MDKLLEIFGRTTSKDVVIAIISFFSNLLSNINQKESVNYLLSHPCVISLQNIKFLSLDNEIAEYYINFLNTVSQKVDLSSLHIFFNLVPVRSFRGTRVSLCWCRRLVSIITQRAWSGPRQGVFFFQCWDLTMRRYVNSQWDFLSSLTTSMSVTSSKSTGTSSALLCSFKEINNSSYRTWKP